MRVEVTLMGGFAVRIDGVALPVEQWPRRQAAALVKLLALAPRARLHRDRVIDALWPDVDLDAALPRLYKAAHYARQALGVPDAVAVRNEAVALFPAAELTVDVTAFETAAEAARRTGSLESYRTAIALYRGELLPDDLNEPWSEEPRLRLQGRFEVLVREADEGSTRPEPPLAAVAPPATVPPGPRRRPAATELLEREDELAALDRVARTALRTGRGSVVLVTGEAGSGKSALTQAFLDRLAGDVIAAVGGCDDLLAPRSLGPFRDMADGLPRLASALASNQHEHILSALLQLLATPTVLVLEDVHWADDATLDAIRYLSRRITGVPAVLLLTFREEEVDATHPLRRILGSLSGASTRRLALGPLSLAAVHRLAGGEQAEAAEIHRVTKGNPFFVTEVLDSASDGVGRSRRARPPGMPCTCSSRATPLSSCAACTSLISLSRSCTGGNPKVCTVTVQAGAASTQTVDLATGAVSAVVGVSALRIDATDAAEPSGGGVPPDRYAVAITGATPHAVGTPGSPVLLTQGNVRVPS